jgi:hypothetical protein
MVTGTDRIRRRVKVILEDVDYERMRALATAMVKAAGEGRRVDFVYAGLDISMRALRSAATEAGTKLTECEALLMLADLLVDLAECAR